MRRWRDDLHTLAGAYALDALTRADRDRFERHLGRCEECRQESASLREAASGLAAAAAVAPPPELRRRVLAAASRTRQESPSAAGARGAPARAGRGALSPVAPRLATAVAGMAILIALGMGALTLNARHRLGLAQAGGSAVAEVLTAPDATMMTARGSRGGSATVVMSHRRGELIITTAALPALPAGKRYEVWLMGSGWTRSAGMLPAPEKGMTAPMLAPTLVAGLGAADRIAVTLEPSGGARQPTSPTVVLLALPS